MTSKFQISFAIFFDERIIIIIKFLKFMNFDNLKQFKVDLAVLIL